MNGKTHLIIGVASGLGLSVVFQAAPIAAAMLTSAAAVGSLLPDIDHPNSSISYKVGLARAPLFWLSHRGITHSALIVILITLVGQQIQPMLTQAFSLGYSSHLAADMLTRAGVPLLWPIQTRFRLMPKLFMGGLFELLVLAGSVLACCTLASQLALVWIK